MIKSHYDACRILGVSQTANKEQIKKVYHEICLKYHPDSIYGLTGDEAENAKRYFFLAKEAYEFLEKENVQQISTSKIIGRTNASSYGHESYMKRQNDQRKQREEQKKKKLEELQQKAQQIRQDEKKKKEQEILDQIRWLRVANIIQKTIAEDKIKGRSKKTDE